MKHTIFPQENGLAKRNIQTIKNTKAYESKQDPHLALLSLRTTPLKDGSPSPVQQMMKRIIRTNLPNISHNIYLKKQTNNKKKNEELPMLKPNYHHHHVAPSARISLTLSHYPSLSSIASAGPQGHIPYRHRAVVCKF